MPTTTRQGTKTITMPSAPEESVPEHAPTKNHGHP
jgi:hypothetical protein